MPDDPQLHGDEPLERLGELGAESETERTVKRVVPWVASFTLHCALIFLGFLLTWTVIQLQEDERPLLVKADFDALSYDPMAMLADDLAEIDDPITTDEIVEPVESTLRELTDIDIDLSVISDAASPTQTPDFAPDPTENAATFVGLSSTNARNIIYVIDASGSMIRELETVLGELARSVDRLSPQQNFGLVFFQRDQAIMAPPTSGLVAATPRAKIRALKWVEDNIIPRGRSNPVAAIELALKFKPDVIFLLSENITGSGEFEIDQADLLALLDTLNPTDPETSRRTTQINCVQFLYPDPLDTLRKVAEAHGGPKGYKFLDARELGLAGP